MGNIYTNTKKAVLSAPLFYNVISACLVTWQLIVTATGSPAIWVG